MERLQIIWLLKVRPVVRAVLATALPWVLAGALVLWLVVTYA